MPDKRPFVDRRLALLISLEKQRGVDLEAEEIRTKNSLNDMLNEMGYSVYITDVKNQNDPPQEKIIFNESAMAPETLQRISEKFVQSIEEVGGQVRTIQVVSVALSPGDKVRNAMGV